MARLLAATIVVVFMVLVLSISGDQRVISKRADVKFIDPNQFIQSFCEGNTDPIWSPICGSSTTSTSPASPITAAVEDLGSSSTTGDDEDVSSTTSNPSVSSTSTDANSDTTQSATALERAHWCQFNNGTYLPLGYLFMHTECTLCQCIQSHAIICTTLQCMPTYCIDGSTPTQRDGQCCQQCAYEKESTACAVSGVNIPTGTILRKTTDNVQCWCQLGSVECRKATASLFSGMDFWGSGSAVYVIVIIICAILIFGTLLCCGGTLFFYHYYQRQQRAAQQTYAEYYNNAGWQPMSEDGQVVDGSTEEKQVEAEQNQYEYGYPTNNSEQPIPPPYALYNGSYVPEQGEKDPKNI